MAIEGRLIMRGDEWVHPLCLHPKIPYFPLKSEQFKHERSVQNIFLNSGCGFAKSLILLRSRSSGG
jgi:hypothetical protein